MMDDYFDSKWRAVFMTSIVSDGPHTNFFGLEIKFRVIILEGGGTVDAASPKELLALTESFDMRHLRSRTKAHEVVLRVLSTPWYMLASQPVRGDSA